MDLPEFTVSLISSASAALDAEAHEHSQPNFVLPLVGGFYSEAWGYQGEHSGKEWIFTPAGQAHRDSMARIGGRFIAISLSENLIAGTGADLPDYATAIRSAEARTISQELIGSLFAPAWEALDFQHFILELLEAARPAGCGAVGAPCVIRAVERLNGCNPAEPVSIFELAAECGAHPVYFSRAFRKATGCSPSRYVVRRRVAWAAGQIRGGRQDLAQLALEAGFYDQSHFTRAFKMIFGETPGRYTKLVA
ncbi:MAG: helix-turn-helix domain-containing protein [Caulobacteraceae bacterium]